MKAFIFDKIIDFVYWLEEDKLEHWTKNDGIGAPCNTMEWGYDGKWITSSSHECGGNHTQVGGNLIVIHRGEDDYNGTYYWMTFPRWDRFKRWDVIRYKRKLFRMDIFFGLIKGIGVKKAWAWSRDLSNSVNIEWLRGKYFLKTK